MIIRKGSLATCALQQRGDTGQHIEVHLTTKLSQNKCSTGACPATEQLNEAAVCCICICICMLSRSERTVQAGMSWKQPNYYFTLFTAVVLN